MTLLERRMRGDLIETFKTMEDIFSVFLFKVEIYSQDKS